MKHFFFLFLGLASVSAWSDTGRECYLRLTTETEGGSKLKAPEGIQDVGCFTKVEASEEHAYGHRICLFTSGKKTEATLYVYDSGPEPDHVLVDSVKYDAKSGSLSAKGSKRFKLAFDDVGPETFNVSLSGKLKAGKLTAQIRSPKEPKPLKVEMTKDEGLGAVGEWQRLELLKKVAECAMKKK